MFERIKNLAIKEFIQAFRSRRRVFFILVAPVLQLFVFGYVATMDVNNVPTALVDNDRSQESRELVRRFEASGYFTINHWPDSANQMALLIDKGTVIMGIEIPEGFSKTVRRGMPAQMQVMVDGADSNTALIALSYLNTIVINYSKELSAPVQINRIPVDFRTRVWYNPDLRSRNYFLPGVIALIVMLICLMLTSMAVVQEREVGTMEQLMVTPLKPIELMLGKTIPPAMVGFADMLLVTLGAVLWFHVPIKGGILFLSLCTTVYLLSVLGIGLYISTISKTQQQAMMATFFFFQPAILLSGFATPIDNMPMVFQYITYLSPLRYFLVIVRGIFLKGVGWDVLWPQVLALFILGVLILSLSALRFKKRLS
jgi:ABC-2 type transport system permease protein